MPPRHARHARNRPAAVARRAASRSPPTPRCNRARRSPPRPKYRPSSPSGRTPLQLSPDTPPAWSPRTIRRHTPALDAAPRRHRARPLKPHDRRRRPDARARRTPTRTLKRPPEQTQRRPEARRPTASPTRRRSATQSAYPPPPLPNEPHLERTAQGGDARRSKTAGVAGPADRALTHRPEAPRRRAEGMARRTARAETRSAQRVGGDCRHSSLASTSDRAGRAPALWPKEWRAGAARVMAPRTDRTRAPAPVSDRAARGFASRLRRDSRLSGRRRRTPFA
jgi:hypothetical protein